MPTARSRPRRVARWEWTWAVLLAAGVAVIVIVGNPHPGRSHWSLKTWLTVGAVMLLARILCGAGAWMWPGTRRAVLQEVVSLSLWGEGGRRASASQPADEFGAGFNRDHDSAPTGQLVAILPGQQGRRYDGETWPDHFIRTVHGLPEGNSGTVERPTPNGGHA